MFRMLLIPLLVATLLLAGCAQISVRTHPYLGVGSYPPSNPDRVVVLATEPNRPKERLGEIFLDVGGEADRELIEKKLRFAGAELGADAVFIVKDQTRLYPVVYVDPWWGATTTGQGQSRGIIAVAIRYR